MELKHKEIAYNTNRLNLLIVPYGIETNLQLVSLSFHFLLIVPYGIETGSQWRVNVMQGAFNRTLWN